MVFSPMQMADAKSFAVELGSNPWLNKCSIIWRRQHQQLCNPEKTKFCFGGVPEGPTKGLGVPPGGMGLLPRGAAMHDLTVAAGADLAPRHHQLQAPQVRSLCQ
ncbi:hypothetical protein HPP92_001472 [Vanilla planifolia]|uniref:Uncharacterized protein n=1 Tax=Vanilla planifolia TaxID=51239 RepID=A0A835VHK9_VANPL|nr:hypothetical protein HPP92_001472 [Vanilla planifolia]